MSEEKYVTEKTYNSNNWIVGFVQIMTAITILVVSVANYMSIKNLQHRIEKIESGCAYSQTSIWDFR